MWPYLTPPEPSPVPVSGGAAPIEVDHPVRVRGVSIAFTLLAVLGVTTPVGLTLGVDPLGMLSTEDAWPVLLVPFTLVSLVAGWTTNRAARRSGRYSLAAIHWACLAWGWPALMVFLAVMMSSGPHT